MDLSQKTVEQPPLEASSNQIEQSTKRSRFRWLWRVLLICLLLLIGAAVFLSTLTGQKTALKLVDELLDELSIGQVEGQLQDGLSLKAVRYQTDGVEVLVGQADLHLGFRCLMDKRACVENVALRDVSVQIETDKLPPAQPKEEKPFTTFNLPIPVSLKQVALDNLNVKVDDTEIFLAHFHTGIEGEHQALTLQPTELHGLTISLPPQAEEKPQKSAKEREKVDWEALEKTLRQPLLNKLKPIKLPLHLSIPSFKATEIQLERKVKNAQGQWAEPRAIVSLPLVELQGKADEQRVELTQFTLRSDKGNISGSGHLSLVEDYPLNWQVKAESSLLPEWKIPASQADISLSGELFGTTHLDIKTTGAVNAQLSGKVALSEEKTPFSLKLNSKQASYPFMPEKGREPLTLRGLDLRLSGDLLGYQLDGSSALGGMGIPNGAVRLRGQGGLTQFDLSALVLEILGGKAELSGKLDWAEGIGWQSKAQLAELNTASLLSDWPAVLSGSLSSQGYAGRGKQGDEWAVSVKEMDLNGRLFDKKLQLKGELQSDYATLLSVPVTRLIYGENTVVLKGTLGEKSDFIAEIDAPNLKGLVPHLQAAAKGNVKLQGKLSAPELVLDLTAANVAYNKFNLKQFVAKGKVTTDKQIYADLNLQFKQLGVGDIQINQAEITLKGNEDAHQLQLASNGEPVGLDLQISGKFDRLQQRWQGQLSQVQTKTALGTIQNDKPVQIAYLHKSLNTEISAHCWQHTKIKLCFPTAFQAGVEGKVPFEITQFDLTMLQEYLNKQTQLSGIVNAKGEAAWFKNGSPRVNVALNAGPLQIKQTLDGQAIPLTFSRFILNATLKENNLQLNTDVQLENNGRLSSELMMKEIANKRALSGHIQLDKLHLGLLKPLLRHDEQLDGDIHARLTLGGTAQSPLLYGDLNLSALKVQSKMMPFDIINGGLAMHFAGARSTLNGSVQSQDGTLSLSGEADWRNLNAWHSRIQATSDKFRLNLPELGKVDVSPNIEVSVTPKLLNLSGNIDIPWARIEVQELPESAVSISGDEVIMDGTSKQKRTFSVLNAKNSPKTGQGMSINGDISVNIGKDVRLEAYGLKTHLQGLLKVRQGNRGLGLYGQVNLNNGTFASFGQDLIIRKGVISFTGLPSQPTLDIEAIRNPAAMDNSSITAGVRATGLADNLDVKIFSDPSMSQDQALSYLLTGRGLDNNEGASGNSVAAALIGLGLSKSSKTVGSVGSAFGISDLNVSTEGIGDNTKVVVSGSLNSRLKVEYGVGLFAPLTELALRYRLAPNLYLQWVSGINQAVDLLYRFEFD